MRESELMRIMHAPQLIRLSICIVICLISPGLAQGVYRYYDFDANQQSMIVNEHNRLRSVEPAINMQEMVWDSNLASMAKYWAGQCTARHTTPSSRHNRYGYDRIGENIWWTSEKSLRTDLASVIRSFYSEKTDYDFFNRYCSGVNCAHYTQVVWATSCAVGCSAAYCANIRNGGSISEGHIIVCNYGPAGNWRGYDPYVYGKQCNACPYTCTANWLCPSSCTAKP